MNRWIIDWGFRETDFSLFPMYAENETQRVWFRNNLDSDRIRVRLSNRYGRHPVFLDCVTAAVCDENGVLTGKSVSIKKDGKDSIILDPRCITYSDPAELSVKPGDWISVSIYIKERTMLTTAVSSQSSIMSRMNTGMGNLCNAPSVGGTGFFGGATLFRELKPHHGFIPAILNQVEAECSQDVRKVLYFGDSMTQHEHWSGALSKKLHDRWPGRITCYNRGIHGNRVLHDASIRTDFGRYFGEGGLERFEEDAFGTPEGHYPDVVVFQIGINDILHPFSDACAPYEKVSADEIIEGLNRLIRMARKHGAKVYGTTITPFGNFSAAWCEVAEQIRCSVNRAVREGRVRYDLFFDFDKIVKDPDNPVMLRKEYDSGDGLHPNAVGGQTIADAIDSELFV